MRAPSAILSACPGCDPLPVADDRICAILPDRIRFAAVPQGGRFEKGKRPGWFKSEEKERLSGHCRVSLSVSLVLGGRQTQRSCRQRYNTNPPGTVPEGRPINFTVNLLILDPTRICRNRFVAKIIFNMDYFITDPLSCFSCSLLLLLSTNIHHLPRSTVRYWTSWI